MTSPAPVEGLLSVTVVRATGLPQVKKADPNVYVQLSLVDNAGKTRKEVKTAVLKHQSTPEWDEIFEFEFSSEKFDCIRLQVLHQGSGLLAKKDRCLGQVEIESAMCVFGSHSSVYPLLPKPTTKSKRLSLSSPAEVAVGAVQGNLALALRFTPLEPAVQVESAEPHGGGKDPLMLKRLAQVLQLPAVEYVSIRMTASCHAQTTGAPDRGTLVVTKHYVCFLASEEARGFSFKRKAILALQRNEGNAQWVLTTDALVVYLTALSEEKDDKLSRVFKRELGRLPAAEAHRSPEEVTENTNEVAAAALSPRSAARAPFSYLLADSAVHLTKEAFRLDRDVTRLARLAAPSRQEAPGLFLEAAGLEKEALFLQQQSTDLVDAAASPGAATRLRQEAERFQGVACRLGASAARFGALAEWDDQLVAAEASRLRQESGQLLSRASVADTKEVAALARELGTTWTQAEALAGLPEAAAVQEDLARTRRQAAVEVERLCNLPIAGQDRFGFVRTSMVKAVAAQRAAEVAAKETAEAVAAQRAADRAAAAASQLAAREAERQAQQAAQDERDAAAEAEAARQSQAAQEEADRAAAAAEEAAAKEAQEAKEAQAEADRLAAAGEAEAAEAARATAAKEQAEADAAALESQRLADEAAAAMASEAARQKAAAAAQEAARKANEEEAEAAAALQAEADKAAAEAAQVAAKEIKEAEEAQAEADRLAEEARQEATKTESEDQRAIKARQPVKNPETPTNNPPAAQVTTTKPEPAKGQKAKQSEMTKQKQTNNSPTTDRSIEAIQEPKAAAGDQNGWCVPVFVGVAVVAVATAGVAAFM